MMDNEQPNPEEVLEQTFEQKVKSLTEEAKHFNEPIEQVAERYIKDNLPLAIVQLARLAEHAHNESVRLKAATYLVDRGLGRIQDSNPPGRKDPLGQFIEQIQDAANQGGN